MKKKIPYLVLTGLLVAADQVSKAVVERSIRLFDSLTVIPGFLNLTHIRNRGAIFGFFSQGGNGTLRFTLITAAAVVALLLVIYYFLKTPASDRLALVGLSSILAGALGNQLDRFLKGYVTDFVDMYIKRWHWPFFNVADSCITVGAILLLASLFLRRREPCTPSS